MRQLNSNMSLVKIMQKRTPEEQAKAEKRLLKRQRERKRKLAEAGIEYDLEAVSYKRR